MKIVPFIIFFTIFLTIYGLINYYILIRGWQAMPKIPLLRICYLAVTLFLVISYIAGRIIGRLSVCATSDMLVWVGSFWLSVITYLLIGILVVDILRAANHFFNFFPALLTNNYEKTKLIAAMAVIWASVLVAIAGHINSRIPVLRKLELNIPKSAGDLKSLKIILASDIHLGTIISNTRLEKMVDMINNRKPDIILFAGDIVDENLEPVIKNNLGHTLIRLKSKYGTYAITGNHEFIGGVVPAVQCLETTI